jgi:hypothetical protein
MEDDHPAHFQNERDSVRNLAMRAEERRLKFEQIMDIMPTIVEEDEEEDDTQSIMDSVGTVEEEDERPSHFQNEGDSVIINKQRLPLTLTEETVGLQVSMDSPVKVGRSKEISIKSSRATVEKEKKGQMNKMGVCLAPTILKAKGSKGVSQSSTCHRPGGRDVKIYNKRWTIAR